MTARLHVHQLSAGYFGGAVIRDVDFEVASGEIVALLGANGVGKSTTLRTIAGLQPPMAGHIRLNGACLDRIPAHVVARRGLVLVPEGRSVFRDLTVRENLKLADRRRRRALPVVLDAMPELEKCLDRRVAVLSGGEQQMVALGHAIMAQPQVVLIDELSLGLAPIVVQRLEPVIRRFADSWGAAVVLVEQHAGVSLRLANRALVMSQGRIAWRGATELLRSDPAILSRAYFNTGDFSTATRR
jgi:branched-chain amino acid transport system ATP-binding protein